MGKHLTSAEIGKLWVTYIGNTLSRPILTYYLKNTDDPDIKKIVSDALSLCKQIIQTIEKVLKEEKYPIPIGYTDADVNLEAPRLFADDFYLFYLRYTGKAGMSIYAMAIPLVTREDLRNFYIDTLNSTMQLIVEIDSVLMKKGLLSKPPVIPVMEKVDFIKKQNYLNGFFGNVRSLHALEIAHLYDNLDSNVASRALLIGFSQVAESEKVRQYLQRGKEITSKHIKHSSEQLHKDNLPSPPILDHLVTTSTISPFSDKLMLSHKIDMFSMKIRTYANALSLNGRRDIGAMYGRFIMDIGKYVEDGANIMIDQGWMEQPPKAANRESLSKE